MRKAIEIIRVSLFSLVTVVSTTWATPEHLDLKYKLDLDDFRGQTFLATMLEKDVGLVADMNADYSNTTYEFPTWKEVERALDNFDRKNLRRVWAAFDSRADMKRFVRRMQGKRYRPGTMYHLLKGQLSGNLTSISHFFAMAGGAGSLVIIDKDNYFYNIGYKLGDKSGDERSGRSYAASPVHPANDVSHKRYLQDLEEYLSGDQDELFYEVMMSVLTQTDDSQFSLLSDLGESVGTDFIAVYVAELRRHLMADLNPRRRPWANDYAEVTLVNAFVSAARGKMILKVTDKKGKTVLRFKKAPMYKWWELNPVTGRSGIGKTRRERRMLQRHITNYMKENHRHLVDEVQSVTGKRSDVFQGLMEFLNNFKTPSDLGLQAELLNEAFVELLLQVQEDADLISDYILESDSSLAPKRGDKNWYPSRGR